ncbi:ABC transporter ATP-binding protein [Corynebacterium sp. MSK006]|uniref:ABC transporter ATP-binding protein n=1 Tax=Corynebacterium sp. MSK006 TaxID=3050187 RepID=UPI00254A326E|nr:ABC transporter ATP-binding protein [Corynebacterium sp. MSK006]MDK8894265.1 ABC transporter ATP-binding protein [Corynebacterium sp. MSK006]
MGIEGRRGLFAILLLFAAVAGVVTATQPFLTGKVLDVVASNDPSRTRTVIVLLVCVFLADVFLQVVCTFLKAQLGGSFAQNLRRESLKKFGSSQILGKGALEGADVQNRTLADTALVAAPSINILPDAIRSLVLVLGCVVGMVVLLPGTFFILLGAIAVCAACAFLVGKWIKATTYDVRKTSSAYAETILNFITGIKVLKSRNLVGWALGRCESDSEKLRKSGIKADIANGMLMPTLNIGTQLALVLSIALVTTAMFTGKASAGEGTAFLMFLLYAISPLVELGLAIASWNAAQASSGRLQELWSVQQETSGNVVLEAEGEASLELRDLNYRFPEAEGYLFEDFNLKLDHPGLYLLRGPNGSGKSTLLEIANGLLPSSEMVFVDGTDSEEIDKSSLRTNVLLVDQYREPIKGTLRDNIGAGLRISDEERLEALRKSGFANHFSDLDMRVGGAGVQLSGGQRSLLALADAFARNPKILLLDEVMAGVDRSTAEDVRDAIEDFAADHIVVAVAHDDSLDRVAARSISMEECSR